MEWMLDYPSLLSLFILNIVDINLWGIGFHAVVVFGLSKNFLFKSILGRCDRDVTFDQIKGP